MKNPYLNAGLAALYIAVVGTFMHWVEKGYANTPDKWFSGIALISLVTLSVAMMGYFFALRPLQIYLDGDKVGATTFFLKTVGTFALITIILFLFLFVG